MISLHNARALIQAKIQPLPGQAALLEKALGRVLREDVFAADDLPAFDRSAMDGYAVGLDDDSPRFRVVGEIQPGVAPALTLQRGECARIFTGAQIPSGASQVLMQEDVRAEENVVTPLRRSRITHIRRRGEDARRGDLLLKNGARLGAGELALLSSLGVVQPKVSPPSRVVHFATGNELIDPAQAPAPGQIRDSNSTLVAALVNAFGDELAWQERVPDDLDMLVQKAHARFEQGCDLLLVSGGASVGRYDFGRPLLAKLGFQTHFEKINLRPGKPLVFATRDRQAAFILPGNPVSHFVVLHAAVRLALEMYAGAEAHWPLAKVRLAENFDYRPDTRETYWPARVTIQDGELVSHALPWQSSGDVAGLAGANALLQFPGRIDSPKAGDIIQALLLELP
jgi:molybdopterin molybdotransferase